MRNLRMAAILILLFTPYCFFPDACVAQEAVPQEEAIVSSGPEIQWLWGQVVSVDAKAGQLSVKYIDYDTDSEKEMLISADAKTTYENVGSLGEVKLLDSVSIDYVVSPEGKNTAGNISVEKVEVPEAYEEGPADLEESGVSPEGKE